MTLKELLEKLRDAGIKQDDQLPPVKFYSYQESGCCCGECCNSGYDSPFKGDIESVDKESISLGYVEEE